MAGCLRRGRADRRNDGRDPLRNSNEWKRDNGQYIPKPENWIKERRWEDKIDDLGPPTGQGGITGYQDKAATDLAAAANGIA